MIFEGGGNMAVYYCFFTVFQNYFSQAVMFAKTKSFHDIGVSKSLSFFKKYYLYIHFTGSRISKPGKRRLWQANEICWLALVDQGIS